MGWKSREVEGSDCLPLVVFHLSLRSRNRVGDLPKPLKRLIKQPTPSDMIEILLTKQHPWA